MAEPDTSKQNNNPLDLRLEMVNAMLDLNEAMLEGVKASIDTLNLPENDNKNVVNEKDIQGTLLRMKRLRDRSLLMPYLLHLQDSLSNEIGFLQTEKVKLENTIEQSKITTHVKADSTAVGGGSSTATIKTKRFKHDKDVIVTDVQSSTEPAKVKARKKPEKKTAENKGIEHPGKIATAIPDTVLVFDIEPPNKIDPKAAKKNSKHLKHERNQVQVVRHIDTAAIRHALRDTTLSLKIMVPNSNDSLVIKPLKNTHKKEEKPVASNVKPETIPVEVIGAVPGEEKLSAKDSAKIKKAVALLKEANADIANKNTKSAQGHIAKALVLYPKYYDAWVLQASIDAKTGADTKALGEYSKAIEIDSTKEKAYYEMGKLYMKSNRKTEAFESYTKAIAADPAAIDPLMQRAAIYYANKEYKNAIADYDSVISISKVYYLAYRERGMAKLMLYYYNDAADDFTRFLIFKPEDAMAYYYRGLSRIGNRENEDGCLDFNTALKLGYTNAQSAIDKSCK